MTKFTNRKEIRYVCGNRLGFHIFIISACSRNVKYILTKIRSCARQLFARCRRGDSRARRCTCSPYKPPSKWQTPPICHCEEAKGRRGALSAKREEVPLGCNLGKAAAFSPIAFPRCGRVLRDCHVALLLAMTRQGVPGMYRTLLPLNGLHGTLAVYCRITKTPGETGVLEYPLSSLPDRRLAPEREKVSRLSLPDDSLICE